MYVSHQHQTPAAAANREEQIYQTLTNDCTTDQPFDPVDGWTFCFASRRIDKQLHSFYTRRLLNGVESYGIKFKKNKKNTQPKIPKPNQLVCGILLLDRQKIEIASAKSWITSTFSILHKQTRTQNIS